MRQRLVNLVQRQGRCLVCQHQNRQQIEATMFHQGMSVKERCQAANEKGFIIPYYSYLRHWKGHPLTATAMQVDKKVQEQTAITVDQLLEATIEAGYQRVSSKPNSVSVRDAITASKVKTVRDQFQEKSDMIKTLLMQYMSGEIKSEEELTISKE